MQATFLKGKSVNAQNPALREELELLEPDALALRCRRNGVSREGGSDPQIQRLINLQAYLSGDLENEPASAKAAPEAIPAVSFFHAHRSGFRFHWESGQTILQEASNLFYIYSLMSYQMPSCSLTEP